LAAASGLSGVVPLHAAQVQPRLAAPSRPNILFMLSDNVGYGVLSSYNGGISDTPTQVEAWHELHVSADGLARNWISFSQQLEAPAPLRTFSGEWAHRQQATRTRCR
jgi:arylsulfatase A-like enzyme